MFLWSWIPHLHPSLDIKWTAEEIQDILVADSEVFGLHIDDSDPKKYWSASFEVLGDAFEYNKWCLICRIDDLNGNEVSVRIRIGTDGIIGFDIDSDMGDEDYSRHLINELYFLMKRLLHDDVYHESDPIHLIYNGVSQNDDKDYNRHPDYSLPPIVANERDAAKGIYRLFTTNLDVIIKSWKEHSGSKFMPDDERRLALGYVTFGRAFCNCVDEFKDRQTMMNSFDNYGLVIDELSDDARRKESKASADTVNESVIKLTICTILLMYVSIFVAFFAGSSFANSLSSYKLTVCATVLAFIGIVLVCGCIYLRYDLKPLLKKKQ